jgi:formylglycine-generating enzyme required for sulfatase activity
MNNTFRRGNMQRFLLMDDLIGFMCIIVEKMRTIALISALMLTPGLMQDILGQDAGFKDFEFATPGSTYVIHMKAIGGGSFRMGGRTMSKEVKVSDFWIGAFEVTHDQFGVFYKDEQTSQGSKVDAVTRPTAQYIDLSWGMGKDGGFPVNSMSVDGAMMFCRWLYRKTGIFYRLPTEAEWEYACRAGSTKLYPFGDDPKLLNQHAWFAGNSKGKYQKVGQKKPNAWGLYDMLGNVAEWTLDQFDPNYFKSIGENPVDPLIKPTSRYPRSIRGGSYLDAADLLAPSIRGKSDPSWNKRDPQIPKSRWWLTDGTFAGFRIVSPKLQPAAEDAENFYTLYLGK